MPSPEVINWISGIGFTGGTVLVIWALMTRKVYTAGEHKETIERYEKHIADIKSEAAKQIAEKNQEIVLWRDLTYKNSDVADEIARRLPSRTT